MSGDPAYAAGQARTYLRGELEGRDPQFIREFAGLVQDPETLDYLNYMCSLYASDEQDYLDTPDARDILQGAATATTDEAFEFGNVSQLQGIVGLVNQAEEGEAAILRMASALALEGMVALTLGPPGSGKTTLCGDVAMAWKATTGGVIVSNSKNFEGTDLYVTTDAEAKEAMGSTPKPCLLFVDELSKKLTSRGDDQQAADEFAKTLKFMRKRQTAGSHPSRASFLGVGHTVKDTAAELRRLATLVAQKPSMEDKGKVRIFESEGGEDRLEDPTEYKGLTDSTFDTDEHEPSTFTVGLEDDDEGTDTPDPNTIKKREATATAIRAVARGESYEDAAELIPFSREWVGRRYREWRDNGQHSELVDVDPPEDETA